MPIQLQRLSLSSAKLKALPPFDRYVFALVGHIFNDLMIGGKQMHICGKPPADAHEFQLDAALGMSAYALRTFVGHVKEAMDSLTQTRVENHLVNFYFGPVNGLTDRWKVAVKQYEELDARWMTKVRNHHCFHYMEPSQWEPTLGDGMCDGGYVLVGKRFGDTFFTWGDHMAMLAMGESVKAKDPFEGLSQMLKELSDIMGELTDCLANGAQQYMRNHLTDDNCLSDPVTVDAPDINDIPPVYFFRRQSLHGRGILNPQALESIDVDVMHGGQFVTVGCSCGIELHTAIRSTESGRD